jgi:hypothetical protein
MQNTPTRRRQHTGGISAIERLEHRTLLAAQAYDWRDVTMKGTGFINGIVFSPAQAGLAYANTDMGGAYRWDQSAAKWTPLTDWIQTTDWSVNYNGAETIAVDPNDASRVYLGLGLTTGPARSCARPTKAAPGCARTCRG